MTLPYSPMFNPAETAACQALIDLALREDLGPEADRRADATSSALLDPVSVGGAKFVVRREGVLAGLEAARLVCAAVDPALQLQFLAQDGDRILPGTAIAVAKGPVASMLTSERTALNFLQRLSGVATSTRRYVDAIAGLPGKILDTRKTTPGWRRLEKYAVRMGGGTNHRLGLFDGILIKDNHLAATRGRISIAEAIRKARAHRQAGSDAPLPVEIEVDTLEQLVEALSAGAELVLLDNMTLAQLRAAVQRRNAISPGTQLEASGGVDLSTVRAIAETGVDRISVGALTHSSPALDIALDYDL